MKCLSETWKLGCPPRVKLVDCNRWWMQFCASLETIKTFSQSFLGRISLWENCTGIATRETKSYTAVFWRKEGRCLSGKQVLRIQEFKRPALWGRYRLRVFWAGPTEKLLKINSWFSFHNCKVTYWKFAFFSYRAIGRKDNALVKLSETSNSCIFINKLAFWNISCINVFVSLS